MAFLTHLSEEKEKKRLKSVHLARPKYNFPVAIINLDQEAKKADLEPV